MSPTATTTGTTIGAMDLDAAISARRGPSVEAGWTALGVVVLLAV